MVKAKIPFWAKSILKGEDLKLIEDKIHEVELSSSAEVVVMVVPQSARTGHVTPLLILLLALLAELLLSYFGFDRAWEHALGLGLASLLGWWGAQFSVFQRWLTSEADLAAQVNLRAEVEFFEAGLQKTEGQTALLFFISLMERRAVVLADRGISQHLGTATWNSSIEEIIGGIRARRLGEGIVKALGLSEGALKKHFPRSAMDRNEVLNHVRFRE